MMLPGTPSPVAHAVRQALAASAHNAAKPDTPAPPPKRRALLPFWQELVEQFHSTRAQFTKQLYLKPVPFWRRWMDRARDIFLRYVDSQPRDVLMRTVALGGLFAWVLFVIALVAGIVPAMKLTALIASWEAVSVWRRRGVGL